MGLIVTTGSRRAWVHRRAGSFGGDLPWLATMAMTTLIECGWWTIAWSNGLAPGAYLWTYLALAFAGLAGALVVKRIFTGGWSDAPWRSVVAATFIIGFGASLFLPLKYAIPQEVPFWFDDPLAAAEQSIFGQHPALLLDHLFGWADVPLDRLYSLWLPVQSLVLFLLILQRPSRAKSRALIAYSLAWLILGVAAATVFSSAGPLFHDRLLGGHSFHLMRATLQSRGAWIALAESDKMWTSFLSGTPGFVAGMSAVPSMHVAISLWIWLTVRLISPRLQWFAALYFGLIAIGSVQLGWHYVSDGLAGVLGMLIVWKFAARIEQLFASRPDRAGPMAERVSDCQSHNALKYMRRAGAPKR
jgi:PAP2 superfamily protein